MLTGSLTKLLKLNGTSESSSTGWRFAKRCEYWLCRISTCLSGFCGSGGLADCCELILAKELYCKWDQEEPDASRALGDVLARRRAKHVGRR